MAFLLVDSSCDLPSSFVQNKQIGILPAKVTIGGKQMMDARDDDILATFYKNDLFTKGSDANSEPWSAVEISEYALREVVPEHDTLLVQTLARARSKTYDNANYASSVVNRDFRKLKATGDFSMRVNDTGSVFSGMGVLAIHTRMLMDQGLSGAKLRQDIENIKSNLWCYAAVKNIKHLRTQLQKRGDDGISWMSAAFGQALEITPVLCGRKSRAYAVGKMRGFDKTVNSMFSKTIQQVKSGLVSPHIVVSIAGQLEELEHFEAYKELKTVCSEHKITLHACMMGMASAVAIGKGTVSIGFAAEGPEFSF